MNLASYRPLVTKGIAFFWGFFFIYLFRFTLNRLYPFWSGQFSLSFFAFLLLFTGWVSFYLFQKRAQSPSRFPLTPLLGIAVLFNLVLLLWLFNKFGETGYIYYNPFFFSIQIFLLFFLYLSRLPYLTFHPVFIMAGAMAGFFLIKFYNETGTVLLIASVLAATPGIIFEKIRERNPGRLRMIPLRQSIDVIRFMLLVLSLFGIFDQFRDRFYAVAGILYTGPVFQYFITRIDQKKHHIKHGTIVLSILFFLLSLAYIELPFTYWAAAGFSALTVWEALYFKKMFDGDYRRDLIIIGSILALALFLYLLSWEWVVLLFGIALIAIQLRIFMYLFKSYRKILSVIFALSLISWGIGVYYKYQDSFKRNFFALSAETPVGEKAPSVYWPFYFKKIPKPIVTNIYPEEVIESAPQSGFPKMVYSNPSGVFLTLKIRMDRFLNNNYIYFYRLPLLKAYADPKGAREIERKKDLLPDLYFYAKNPPYKTAIIPSVEKLNLTPLLSEEEEAAVFRFGMNLGNWYEQNGYYRQCLDVYTELLETYEKRELLVKTARIYGVLGDLKNQIQYLEKAETDPGKDLSETKLLMELYFYDSQFEKSLERAEKLIRLDEENRFSYLEWIFKILKQTGTRTDWLNFLYRVQRITLPKDHRDYLRKESLIIQIRETIEANPAAYEVILKERKRQEKIKVPN